MNEIFTRRSVRQFTNESVKQEDIESILRAAMQAPSAANQQPWEFIVVRGRSQLDALSKYNPYAGCLTQATAAIIVLGNTKRMIFADYWQQDLGALTQNIQLQATSLGLGSVWFGTAPDVERMNFIKEKYALEEHLLPYSVVALGYPLKKDANHFVDRYDASRIRYISEEE